MSWRHNWRVFYRTCIWYDVNDELYQFVVDFSLRVEVQSRLWYNPQMYSTANSFPVFHWRAATRLLARILQFLLSRRRDVASTLIGWSSGIPKIESKRLLTSFLESQNGNAGLINQSACSLHHRRRLSTNRRCYCYGHSRLPVEHSGRVCIHCGYCAPLLRGHQISPILYRPIYFSIFPVQSYRSAELPSIPGMGRHLFRLCSVHTDNDQISFTLEGNFRLAGHRALALITSFRFITK